MRLLRTTALTAALITAAVPILTSSAEAWRGGDGAEADGAEPQWAGAEAGGAGPALVGAEADGAGAVQEWALQRQR